MIQMSYFPLVLIANRGRMMEDRSERVRPMRCQVYCEAKGQLLLVPDSREARSEVERSFGPLKHCGSIDTQDLPAQLVPKIESELSAHCYAVLSFGVIEGVVSGRRDLAGS